MRLHLDVKSLSDIHYNRFEMNYLLLIIVIILIVVIIVFVILYLRYRRNIKTLDVNILNSIYGSDGYFIHYVPLLEVFKNLINIANYDSNYTQVEDGSEYKLGVNYKGNLDYIECLLMEGDYILSESDFQMEWMDINEFYGQAMIKNITPNTLNIGHNKSVVFDLSNDVVNVNNNSWIGMKNNVIESSNINSVGEWNFVLKFKFENGTVIV